MDELPQIQLFNQLYTEYKSRFIRFAISYIQDEEVAKDIVADAFMYYWEHKEELAENSNIPTYIFTIIKNKALNYLQHQKIKQHAGEIIQGKIQYELDMRIFTLDACSPTELFSEEIRELTQTALKKLPEHTRQIFIESRMKNKSHKEIAKNLSISTKTIEFHISKVNKVLRVYLRDYLYFMLLFL